MSQPPNPYNNVTGIPQANANPGASVYNHSQQFNQVPPSQFPPGYGTKHDPNSNSPRHVPIVPPNSMMGHIHNNLNQSANSSPAFNSPGMTPPLSRPAMTPPVPQPGLQALPTRPAVNAPPGLNHNFLPPQSVPQSLSMGGAATVKPSPYLNLQNQNQNQNQINDNAPPLVPSSQYSQPIINGPPLSGPLTSGPPTSAPFQQNQYTATNQCPPIGTRTTLNSSLGPVNPPFTQYQGPAGPPTSKPTGPPGPTQPNIPFSGPLTGPPRNSPHIQGPPVSTSGMGPPPISAAPLGPPSMVPPTAGRPPASTNGPPLGPPAPSGRPLVTGPLGPPRPPGINGPINNSPNPQLPPSQGPPSLGMPPAIGTNGPSKMPPLPNQPYAAMPNGPNGPAMPGPPSGPPNMAGPPRMPPGPNQAPGPTGLPPLGPPSGPSSGPSMGNRYPQMPPNNYGQPPHLASQVQQYPQQYNTQNMTQQMGNLSVTKQGFDQLWGHQMVDLMQCRHILPEYPEEPPEIRLAHQFADAPNCSPEIFRCTVNKIPDSKSLLQKSRLPLGILIHPFKDLNHLPVIQCNTIVRCRACRTYINPFVYFVDAKRWKCNLCYRVNELPEEFQYDPVSKSYGDPSRRPEIKSATIEFIAPGEYMLRPPQPAVYLFLFDVSQLAKDTGYLQVVCDTLKANLSQLPGDARTQVGFIAYDAHIHYYLLSDGLTRPKEMTVIDVDDVFLPSPESLLVNLGDRRELVRELLTVLPSRTAPGVPACALGAALTAAHKLMAPTGGRITVFQTCLPNIGPGALQSREDPNARSSKDVPHLNPATDFYKRIALECSGAQVAVDLFLLSSQYCDLATLSGMSKFSGGSVYHIPLFRATRRWQADQLSRMLTRYLTRKIGFEAVLRVRCTRGIAIHTFHGNFFVRSTDLLSLPNVSPDAGFGMQLAIEESLCDLQHACFQAALLYTSSKGERRIRVHTLALPIATTLPDVLHSADQQCIIGLLCKMAVDRCATASMSEAREALINVAVDALSAHRLAQNLPAGAASAALLAPTSLALLPLLLLAALKRKAFRTGTSTRLDDRVADMCDLKSLPLPQLLLGVYPALYAVHDLLASPPSAQGDLPDAPLIQLSAERINSNGAYLLDDGETMILYVCHAVSPAFLSEVFGVAAFSQVPDESRSLPAIETDGNELLHAFIDKLNDERPYASNILILRDNSPSRQLFTERLVDDRVESAFSYYEFLQHVKSQVK